MNSLYCPFCKNYFVNSQLTYNRFKINFGGVISMQAIVVAPQLTTRTREIPDEEVILVFAKCPNCKKTKITIEGNGANVKQINSNIYPDSAAKVFPDYIPTSIKQDYEEACKILHLSPKASATLSRRCLQGMIRDYWKISKSTLVEEIKSVESKVEPDTQDVLHSLRKLGNIGAHPEKDINLIVDIEPDEAQQLILFLEYLFEVWYIKTHDRKSMLQNIKDISRKKDNERKNQ